MVCSTKTRQPRPKPIPYKRKPRTSQSKDVAATSAKASSTTRRQNLTLKDWLTVFAYIDAHPDLPQERVVRHFKTQPQGALEFTQATLSRKIKNRENLERRIQSYPNALSSKRPRIVTRPDVEEALVEWITGMERKGETCSRTVLREKRRKLEEEFGVPEAECLTGDGWVAPFCRTYHISAFRRHGGSVDAEAVKEDRLRVGLSTFPVQERWDFDESGLFAMVESQREIIGAPLLTIDEMLGPSAEKNVGEATVAVYDDDATIAEVQRQQAISGGNPIEVESDDSDDDDDDDDDDQPKPSATELIEFCEQVEAAYVARLHADSSLDLLHNLRAFRGVLRREVRQKATQTTLDSFWNMQ